ncbi:MAG: hypothetical protein WAT71_14115 [Ignavibacteria bacterium]
MFLKFVDNKIKRETEQFADAKKITKDLISKREVSDFTNNYLLFYLTDDTKAEDIPAMINKANKLYFNYALRPKWTLINFLFNNFESRSPAEILKKLKLFPFYKYYTDAVSDFINDNSMIFITKGEIENIIDRTNQAIHNKLIVEITGQKIKNVFLQLFILNDFYEEKYNLESVIPFSFIKIFLSDKNYSDILSKFDVLGNKQDHENIQLKDIIKVLTGKFSDNENTDNDNTEEGRPIPAADYKTQTEISGSENSNDTTNSLLKKTQDIKGKEIELNISGTSIVENKNKISDKNSDENNNDKESDFSIKKIIKEPNEFSLKNSDEKRNDSDEGFVIKEKIASPKPVPSEHDLESMESNNDTKEKPIGIPLDETKQVSIDKNRDSEKVIFKHKNIDFKELFSEKELDSILNRVYDSNLMARQRSFEKLNNYKTWFEAFNHLKEIFKNNKVDIYHKDVIRYVDALNEHFQNS